MPKNGVHIYNEEKAIKGGAFPVPREDVLKADKKGRSIHAF